MLDTNHNKPRHVLDVQDFRGNDIEQLFDLADAMKEGRLKNSLQGKIIAPIFFEASTRTRMSFESGALRLGGNYTGTENAAEFSSAVKGESLEDMSRVISFYCDAIVVRHKENNAAERFAKTAQVPVINAGCGTGQHPTQAFLDLYTILSKLGGISGREFALIGDLKAGRTVRSLAYLLGRDPTVIIHFVSLKELRVGSDITDYLKRHGVTFFEHESLEDIISKIDVAYVTRLQTERHETESEQDFRHVRRPDNLVFDREMALRMKKGSLLMHPLPRVGELAHDIDDLQQAIYFEQAQNGLYVRMALLHMLLADS